MEWPFAGAAHIIFNNCFDKLFDRQASLRRLRPDALFDLWLEFQRYRHGGMILPSGHRFVAVLGSIGTAVEGVEKGKVVRYILRFVTKKRPLLTELVR